MWYANVSFTRVYPEVQDKLPAGGRDVTRRLRGDVPELPSGRSRLLHVSCDSVSPTARISVTLGPGRPPKGAPQPDIYQRRVLWMSDGWEHFHPKYSMYSGHDGFLAAARTAQRHLNSTPEYHVARCKQDPTASLDEPPWKSAQVATLLRGRADAQAPIDNLGFDADALTEVRMVRNEEHLFVGFRCVQPEEPGKDDWVRVALFDAAKPLLEARCGADGEIATKPKGVSARTHAGQGQWTAILTIPLEAIGRQALARPLQAQFERGRRSRNYVWSPRQDAPWGQFPSERRGMIQFAE